MKVIEIKESALTEINRQVQYILGKSDEEVFVRLAIGIG